MARCSISFERTVTSSTLVLLIFLHTVIVWKQDQAAAAPVSSKRNDILAGTEFLSVFINGAMAPRPIRRRINLKCTNTADNIDSELKNDETNIFRISRVPFDIKPTTSRPRTTLNRKEEVRYYPINHKILDNSHDSFETIFDDLGRPGDISSKLISESGDSIRKPHGKNSNKSVKSINEKVIGVSVTSSVEATPYKVRVEHHDLNHISMITHPPLIIASTVYVTQSSLSTSSIVSQPKITTKTTDVTSSPSRLVTEEFSNIVSESNRSEFSVEEVAPKMSLHNRTFVTPRPTLRHHISVNKHQDTKDSVVSSSNSEPIEQRYEFPERNSEMKEMNHELTEIQSPVLRNQGRKIGRHFEGSSFNHPMKMFATRENGKTYENQHKSIYGDSTKIYDEPRKAYEESSEIYSESANIYGEPSKIYNEPSKIYRKSSKVYGEPEKVYIEPSKMYSQPSKIYSESSKVYTEPSEVYDIKDQHIISEPEEKNYEVDEAVSVGSHGNIHGPQSFTQATNIDEDGHKVGYIVEGRNYRKYRVEERTPDGFIVGEYGVVSHDDGSLRGVRYTADGTINPRLIYDALMKFLAL